MKPLHLDSIDIEIGAGVWLMLWDERVIQPDILFDVKQSSGPPLAFQAKLHDTSVRFPAPLHYLPENPNAGIQALVLFENTGYQWKLHGQSAGALDPDAITSTLKPVGGVNRKAAWNQTMLKGEAPRGSFKVSNYLGTAEIRVAPAYVPVRFEIQSRKFDFHGEYSTMVEDIAGHCQQLLLEWESPTSFNITSDPEAQRRTLLEQFLYLRHVLGSDQLELFFEQISRRPHAALVSERTWHPAAIASSGRLASDPVRYSRAWHTGAPAGIVNCFGMTPGQVLHERRYETFDTPPNRFVLFAISGFRDVCDEVLAAFVGTQGTAYLEALQMRDTIDVFLAQPLFYDVARLRRVPLDSQTLQKREGYRDILRAWLMLDTAAKLDWRGRHDVYDGTNRDAATLYEYWLYFVLRDILVSRIGMQELDKQTNADGPTKVFIAKAASGGLQINLKQGEESLSRFLWTSPAGSELGVHLFYNRTFSRQDDPALAGTYSRQFRPDFTLVFYPAEYLKMEKWRKAEELAVDSGKIGYLHFDAKYRIEMVDRLFGTEGKDALDMEHAETKSTDTYQRGDLYKMHTYNDAIRRTAGSYVIYPGRDGETKTEFLRYEEVVPGVGAFQLCPGASSHRGRCEKTLAEFIADVLSHHGNQFSRNYRIHHWTHRTIKETVPVYAAPAKPAPQVAEPLLDARCVLGYVRPGAAGRVRRTKSFYFYAIAKKQGQPIDAPRELFTAQFFCGHNRSKTFPWLARVRNVRLVTSLEIAGLSGVAVEKAGADYYYLLELDEPIPANSVSVTRLVGIRTGTPIVINLADLHSL